MKRTVVALILLLTSCSPLGKQEATKALSRVTTELTAIREVAKTIEHKAPELKPEVKLVETTRGSANAVTKDSLLIVEDALSPAQLTSMYNEGVAQCYDLIDSDIKTNEQMFIPFNNRAGFVGQELINQASTGSSYDFSPVGTPAYTGSAQIECEA